MERKSHTIGEERTREGRRDTINRTRGLSLKVPDTRSSYMEINGIEVIDITNRARVVVERHSSSFPEVGGFSFQKNTPKNAARKYMAKAAKKKL